MATYTATTNSIIGSDYISGIISGFEDYVIIPISSTETIVLQGKFGKDKTTEGDISFKGERWVISRTGTTGTYTTTYTPEVSCTVSIPNPYYSRGSLSDMSVISSRRAEVAGNFAGISILWGVLICAVLWSLLRRSLRA